jgi:hypothetical protein
MPKEATRQESSSFLKKRAKKLLRAPVRVDRVGRVNRTSKSFLFLFFKKEILPCFAGVSVPTRVDKSERPWLKNALSRSRRK